MLGDGTDGDGGNSRIGVSILVLLDHAGRHALRLHRAFVLLGFRSLFSWIMLGDRRDECPAINANAEFRSLFSWIMLGDSASALAGVP